jgi:hypothetical protein
VSQERETSVELRNATVGSVGAPGIPTSVLQEVKKIISLLFLTDIKQYWKSFRPFQA